MCKPSVLSALNPVIWCAVFWLHLVCTTDFWAPASQHFQLVQMCPHLVGMRKEESVAQTCGKARTELSELLSICWKDLCAARCEKKWEVRSHLMLLVFWQKCCRIFHRTFLKGCYLTSGWWCRYVAGPRDHEQWLVPGLYGECSHCSIPEFLGDKEICSFLHVSFSRFVVSIWIWSRLWLTTRTKRSRRTAKRKATPLIFCNR